MEENHPLALSQKTLRETDTAQMALTDGQDYCRICRGEGSPDQPLFYPCKCSGSIKFVHQECLMEWLSHSQKKYCELCKTSFRFTKLYDGSMPTTIPFPLFVRQLARHGILTLLKWTRYLIVGQLWVSCLPWCIRQIWRGLFWLADGNWMDENSTLMSNIPTSSVNVTNVATANVEGEWFMSLFNIQVLLSHLPRLLVGDGLVGILLRLYEWMFTHDLGQSTETNTNSTTAPASASRRSPSLLSEVNYLTSWSSSPFMSNVFVDIVEGQLICISLITAFILVFLIREWVINQQPLPNLPDPDMADNAAVMARQAPQQDEDGGGGNPWEQRGGIPDWLDDDGNPRLPRFQRGQRHVAARRLRRVVTDDNIGNIPGGRTVNRPTHVRSASVSNTDGLEDGIQPFRQALTEQHLTGQSSAASGDGDAQPSGRTPNNTILVRSEIDVIVNIPPGDSDEEANSIIRNQSESSRNIMRPTMLPEDDTTSNGESSSSVAALSTPSSTHTDSSSSSNAATAGTQPEEETAQQDHSSEELVHADGRSMVHKISAWLWHVDGADVASTLPIVQVQTQDDEAIVENIDAEAPFVPNHRREPFVQPPLLPAEAAMHLAEAMRPPELEDPNAIVGVDRVPENDLNVDGDMEELDGILELLGMEGPIFGMIQNIVFSLFLISLCLSASVWCPYIWGKIAILLVSNPVNMLIKAPLFGLSRTADILIDLIFFVVGVTGFLFSQVLKVMNVFTFAPFPTLTGFLKPDKIESLFAALSQKTGTRLEKTVSGAFLTLTPDLPTFSMLSHQALLSLKSSVKSQSRDILTFLLQLREVYTTSSTTGQSILGLISVIWQTLVTIGVHTTQGLIKESHGLFTNPSSLKVVHSTVDVSAVHWSVEDRVITIMLGYAFFVVSSMAFLRLAYVFLGLKDGEKVEGVPADFLRQAGGVMKVIVIIGIEMLLFPLYCGLLLDWALLPLFAGATVQERVNFIVEAPFTGVFLHWFFGTCYMFHFALFVSICRKILRKGVLYFIRDPDDPTFHPVRDVLERPVPTQLGKIAFSALVYGGLVTICLGSVVWTLEMIPGVFPIRWATSEPKLAFPVDILFYNFMLPFVLRKVELSKKLTAMYEWWFRGCASSLRLTAFLFGEEREEEKHERPSMFGSRQDSRPVRSGTYVRAPATDSVRIPRDQQVFLEVTEDNKRVDGQPDRETGIHGMSDSRFVKVYIPPRFRARIATFILLLWLFAAFTGVAFTIGPLVVGRKITQWLSKSDLPPNDIYAYTIGIHLTAFVAYAVVNTKIAILRLKNGTVRRFNDYHVLAARAKHGLGLMYLGLFTTVVLPTILALITELYIHMPLFILFGSRHHTEHTATTDTVQVQSPTIFILQTWTIGLFYLRLALRLILSYLAPQSRAAVAIRAIVRDGILRPDVPLASRAFVLPATVICSMLIVAPLFCARVWISLLGVVDAGMQMFIYRLAYPGLLGLGAVLYSIWAAQRQLASWRMKIRDEVYLIGERLHNFHEKAPEKELVRTGKQKAL